MLSPTKVHYFNLPKVWGGLCGKRGGCQGLASCLRLLSTMVGCKPGGLGSSWKAGGQPKEQVGGKTEGGRLGRYSRLVESLGVG